ncbi:MAG: hypothetical protein ACSHWQ_06325 [Spongiibacteraceae bacterium]
MDAMYFLGLDIDSGAFLDSVLDKIKAAGLLAIVHTSFNHKKSGLSLKRDMVLRKLQIKTDPSLEQVQTYLREHDKNRYEESFIEAVTVADPKSQTADGVKIILNTPPIEKFRLFFPLLNPVEIVDLAATHQGALDDWEDAITGLARDVLGVHFDTSCTDPSRLFFTPRHPKNGEWASYIVMGDPLDYATVPRVKKSTYLKSRTGNAFTVAGDGDGFAGRVSAVTESGLDVGDWHSKGGKDRFMLADLLENFCPDKIRVAGGEAHGSVHTECPFEHEHTSEGGTATMAVNALDAHTGYWTWFCKHDACQDRHKTEMLAEALDRGWFDEGLLLDPEFLMDVADGDIDELADPDADEIRAQIAANPDAEPKLSSIDSLIENVFTASDGCEVASKEKAIRALYKRLDKRGVDAVERADINRKMKVKSGLDLTTLKGFWKDIDREKYDSEKTETAKDAPTVTEADFSDMVEYAEGRIQTANADDACLFYYLEKMATVHSDPIKGAVLKMLDRDGFAHELNNITNFRQKVDDKDSRHVAAPESVVKHVFAGQLNKLLPPLRGVVTSPIFSPDGQVIVDQGYDEGTALYYQPPSSLKVPDLNPTPTDADVASAKNLLIEVFADFPFAGNTRPQIIEAMDGEGIPAVAHLIAFVLLPFCREMIDGPTPAHLVVKPTPGTGASLLTEVASIISTGVVTPSMAMPTNKDEMGKTLTSVLANGQNIVFFDNIAAKVDSAEFASALTAKVYAARILGKSQTVETEVRCAWVLTGNSVKLSGELVRRLIMIDLDAKRAVPEDRTGFEHANLRGWVQENRGRLVGACLTLIQNWVAKGMPDSGDKILASYESWSRVIGGILNEAGIGGFLGNRENLRGTASDDATGPDQRLMLLLASDYQDGQHFRVKGDGEYGKGAKAKQTLPLIDILHSHNATKGVEPIALNDSGYEYDKGTETFIYTNPSKLVSALKTYVGRTYNVETDEGDKIAVLRTKFDSRYKTDVFILEVENAVPGAEVVELADGSGGSGD